jgi:hypothetical protein
LAAVLFAAVLAGCGGDKPSAAESAFCDGLVAFDAVSTPGGPDEDPVAANRRFATIVADPLAILTANSPSALKSEVAALEAAVAKARVGDPAGGDEVEAAKPAIERWAYDNCGFHKIDVTAEDSRYRGIPSSLKAGKTTIRLRNVGSEVHIMLWLERAPGDNRPAPEAIGAAFASGNFEGFLDVNPAGAAPGQTGGATVNLPPGRYTIFCPIEDEGKPGDPHFAHGMTVDVTVR